VRRRVVIGFLAIVAVAVVAAIVTRPKEGTVEWHKKEFQAAHDELTGRTWFALVEESCRAIANRPRQGPRLTDREALALIAKMDRSRAALVDLGYLVERSFVVSNSARVLGPRLVTHEVEEESTVPEARRQLTVFYKGAGTNEVVVIGFARDMPSWQQEIQRLDVP
jgi:hypothetical protein